MSRRIAPGEGPTPPFTLRLPAAMAAEVAAVRADLEGRFGIPVSRGDALRVLVKEALAARMSAPSATSTSTSRSTSTSTGESTGKSTSKSTSKSTKGPRALAGPGDVAALAAALRGEVNVNLLARNTGLARSRLFALAGRARRGEELGDVEQRTVRLVLEALAPARDEGGTE